MTEDNGWRHNKYGGLFNINKANIEDAVKDYYHSKYGNGKYNEDVSLLGKISGKDKLEQRFGKLKNDDIVITDERIEHIFKSRGVEDGKKVFAFLEDTISNYDNIYINKNMKDTVMYCKEVDSAYCSIVVRLSTVKNELANSVITGIVFGDKTLKQIINTNEKLV